MRRVFSFSFYLAKQKEMVHELKNKLGTSIVFKALYVKETTTNTLTFKGIYLSITKLLSSCVAGIYESI
jgi:hypothetical protein